MKSNWKKKKGKENKIQNQINEVTWKMQNLTIFKEIRKITTYSPSHVIR